MFDVGLGDGRFFSRLKRRFRQGKAYGPSVLVTGSAPVLMVASGANSGANFAALTLISVRTSLRTSPGSAHFVLNFARNFGRQAVRLDVRFAVRIRALRTS